jgi:hypothetical protein
MAQIARLKDAEITNGNIINADDLDAEFNQIISESNGQDTRLTTIESGAFSKSGVMTFLTTPKMDAISPVTTNGATSLILAGAGVNAQTGTTYTVLTGDRYKLVTFSNASPVAVTLPQAGSTGFGNSFEFEAKNIGVGTVTITPTTSTIDGAATITLTTGQSVRIYSDGTNYFTSVGKSSPSTLEYLGTSGAISAAATVDFTTAGWFNGTYTDLEFRLIHVKPTTDNTVIWLRTSVGGTFLSTNEYDYVNNGRSNTDTARTLSAASQAQLIPLVNNNLGNGTNENYCGRIRFSAPNATLWKMLDWQYTYSDLNTAIINASGGGAVKTTSAIDGVRFLMSSGTIASGEIKVYGLRAS